MRRHSRKSSGGDAAGQQQHRSSRPSSSSQQPDPPKHQRTKTAPERPALLRLFSSSSTTASAPARSRRASHNPSTPTAPTAASSATSPSYFSPQSAATSTAGTGAGQDPRSPATRRPPASHSGHGIDNSRGPPVTLVTRGNSDIARRSSQQSPADFASAQQQFQQSGLAPSGGSQRSQSQSQSRPQREAVNASDTPQPQQTNTRAPSQRNSTTSSRPLRHMASSIDESSESDSGPPSPPKHRPAAQSQQDAEESSDSDDEQKEDLFLNIAADSAPRQRPVDSASRIDRLKSRIARVNNRQPSPALYSPSPVPSSSTTPTTTRIPSSVEPSSSGQRRASHQLTSIRTQQERSPLSPALTTPRARQSELSHKQSFSSRKDTDLSPRDFLAQFQRRPSQPETLLTPPGRTGTYRPSNLHYSSTRDDPKTPNVEPVYETASRADGTESHGSTGPAASVWDELDELKTRIRKIELGGKIPATSGAIVSQATADRPRTANTSATTVSSSPNQQRKSNLSPPESTVDTFMSSANKTHPLLREALAKARQHIPPSVYRTLEATATEALTLAEMSGSAGPQGTLHSASSILSGAVVSDRQVRRKADNICRSLTELCIAMCDSKTGLASPAIRSSVATVSRRPSVQINGDSPTIRQSIEPESNTISGVSPSRALSRIEARRTSMLTADANGSQRDRSQEPQDDRPIPSRLSRAGTSLHRTRRSVDDEDDEPDPTLRAPSRAMTDFRAVRSTETSRFNSGRPYISREPLPELQPSPALRPTSALRRPTVTGVANENSLLFRDGQRRYDFNRESSPAYEKQMAGSLRARAQLNTARNPNRNSIGGVSDLGRTVSLGRRTRGASIGE
ncbi:hypothetical protein N0V83_011013 [Neocucurbitaria cava]|uniref:Uncharacterized protein n=1 Tax=Neocucurbitaria cava TaxID=798079 RepID=A0A9W9CHD2_9PLEO|nr:hypothetical protein N0V83_011013 [Neocucurbitaria cava]